VTINALSTETDLARGEFGGLIRTVLNRPFTYAIASPLLSLASAGVGLLVPALLDPLQFGVFVLVSTVFQYAQIFDLGMAQLMDRTWGRQGVTEPRETEAMVGSILWLRLYIVLATTAALVGTVLLVGIPGAPSWTLLLAGLGGVLFTASMGPVTLYRARADCAPFTISAIALQLGMVLPRLIGLAAAGVTGCFAALLAWYSMTALVLNKRAAAAYGRPPGASRSLSLIGSAAPLALNVMLLSAFLTVHRWVSASVSTPEEFGLYAFGMNLLAMIVGAMAPIGQVYYPRRVQQIAVDGLSRVRDRIGIDMGLLLVTMIAGCTLGQFLMPYLIDLVFPHYHEALRVAQISLLALVPITIVTWMMPLLLSVCEKPWLNSLPLWVGIGGVTAGIVVGEAVAGIQGQAWGYAAGALVLAGLELELAVRLGVLRRKAQILLLVGSCAEYAAAFMVLRGL
jgi:O-antigen/teichoic acid export membrane protein